MIGITIVEEEPHYKEQLTDFLNQFEQETGEHMELETYGEVMNLSRI